MLKKPGTYKVGGLGACTLIDKSSLNKGVNFSRLYNISYIGEDRHFCIRAAALGIQLYVDTYYPAYHIYREEDLEGVDEYKKGNINLDFKINRLNAYNTLKVALEGIGDCGYNKPINRQYLNFFEEDLVSSILFNYNGTIIKDRVKNKREIISYKIIEMNNIDEVKIKVIYSDRGYSNDYSYYKEFFSEFIVKILKNEYKIVSWDNKVEREPIVTPLIRKAKDKGNKLTLSMVVKNEENRFLKEVLISAKEYIDNAVIIDDGSTDNTVDIIEDILKDIPYRLIKNEESKFSNEVSLRRQQWDETIKINPDWIVFLDADEIFEDKFKDYIRVLMENTEVDGYLFRLYDFWDENHYRDDSLWCAHNTYRLFLIRYQENYNYLFKETAQHCGRIPYNCINLPYFITTLRLKHYGWARVQDRIEKYNRYMKLDPKGEFGSLEQYKSILDKNPSLTLWEENNM
ncbi:glycosyltransferase [Clostridium sartagoforme]|uniref:Glycosyltransferase n=2 Tax=Clostridium sartagoforme TaxID=84031 RepID=A0A4S2DKR7_9CLOT|nr:glycosyltransferase [Clostridium sartagoforme]